MRRRIIRVTQSPMNTAQWCIELECGHDVWVTAKRRPRTIKGHDCQQGNCAQPPESWRTASGGGA